MLLHNITKYFIIDLCMSSIFDRVYKNFTDFKGVKFVKGDTFNELRVRMGLGNTYRVYYDCTILYVDSKWVELKYWRYVHFDSSDQWVLMSKPGFYCTVVPVSEFINV